MIYLLHGDNTALSRTRLNELRSQFSAKEIRTLAGKAVDETSLTQALGSNSLFGNELVVVIEQLFGKLGRKPKLIESLASIIRQASSSAEVILWEDKEVGVTVTKSLGKDCRVELFKTPAIIFQFLDGILPQSAKTLLPVYANLIATEAPELVWSMLIKRIRQLIMLYDHVTPEGLADWQAARLTTQARAFTIEQLSGLHSQLLSAEYSLKSGSSPFTTRELTELWIIGL